MLHRFEIHYVLKLLHRALWLLSHSSLAITIQGFKKYNLAAKRTFNNLVKCCICSLLDFTWILSSENRTTVHYNLTVLDGLYLNNLYTNPSKIKWSNNFDQDLCKQTNSSFSISLQRIIVVWQLIHIITNSFKKYKNFYLKDRILSLTVHNKLLLYN